MSDTLSVYINNKNVHEYKKTRLPGLERQFLDGMDLDMDEGIELNGELIASPNKDQRAHYVIMCLLHGIENESKGMISSTCRYLANRLPELKKIRAIDENDNFTFDLIFNEIN